MNDDELDEFLRGFEENEKPVPTISDLQVQIALLESKLQTEKENVEKSNKKLLLAVGKIKELNALAQAPIVTFDPQMEENLRQAKQNEAELQKALDECDASKASLKRDNRLLNKEGERLTNDMVALRTQMKRLLALLKQEKRQAQSRTSSVAENERSLQKLKDTAALVSQLDDATKDRLSTVEIELARLQGEYDKIIQKARDQREELKEIEQRSSQKKRALEPDSELPSDLSPFAPSEPKSTWQPSSNYTPHLKKTSFATHLQFMGIPRSRLFKLGQALQKESFSVSKLPLDGVTLDEDLQLAANAIFEELRVSLATEPLVKVVANSFVKQASEGRPNKAQMESKISHITIKHLFSPAASSSSSEVLDKKAAFQEYLQSNDFRKQKGFVLDNLVMDSIYTPELSIDGVYWHLAQLMAFFARFKVKAVKKETKTDYFDGNERKILVSEKFVVGTSDPMQTADNKAIQDLIIALIRSSYPREDELEELGKTGETEEAQPTFKRAFSCTKSKINRLLKNLDYNELDVVLSTAYFRYQKLEDFLRSTLTPLLQYDESQDAYVGGGLKFFKFQYIDEKTKEPMEALQEASLGDELVDGYEFDHYDAGFYMPEYQVSREFVAPYLYDFLMFIYQPREKKVELLKLLNEVQILEFNESQLKKQIEFVREKLVKEENMIDQEWAAGKSDIDVFDIFQEEGIALPDEEEYVDFNKLENEATKHEEAFADRIVGLLVKFASGTARRNAADAIQMSVEAGGYGFTGGLYQQKTRERLRHLFELPKPNTPDTSMLADYAILLLGKIIADMFLLVCFDWHLLSVESRIPVESMFMLIQDKDFLEPTLLRAVLEAKGEPFLIDSIGLHVGEFNNLYHNEDGNEELKAFIEKHKESFPDVLIKIEPVEDDSKAVDLKNLGDFEDIEGTDDEDDEDFKDDGDEDDDFVEDDEDEVTTPPVEEKSTPPPTQEPKPKRRLAPTIIRGKIVSASSVETPSPIRLSLDTSEKPTIITILDPTFKNVGGRAFLTVPFDKNSLEPNSFLAVPNTASIHLPSPSLFNEPGEVTRYARTPGSVDTKVQGTIYKNGDSIAVVDKNGHLWQFNDDDESLSVRYVDPSISMRAFPHIRVPLEDAEKIQSVQYSLRSRVVSSEVFCALTVDNKLNIVAAITNSAPFDIANIGSLSIRHTSVQRFSVDDEVPRAVRYEKARSSDDYASSSTASYVEPVKTLAEAPYEKEIKGVRIPDLFANSTTQIPLETVSVKNVEWIAYFSDVQNVSRSSQKAWLEIPAAAKKDIPGMRCVLADQGERAYVYFPEFVDGSKTPMDVLDGSSMAQVVKFEEQTDNNSKGLVSCSVAIEVRPQSARKLKYVVVSVNGFQQLKTAGSEVSVTPRSSSTFFASPSSSQTLLFIQLKSATSSWPKQFSISFTKVK